jgi:hypothetical protein
VDIAITLADADNNIVAEANPTSNKNPAVSLPASLAHKLPRAGTYYVYIEGLGYGTPPREGSSTAHITYGSYGSYALTVDGTDVEPRPPPPRPPRPRPPSPRPPRPRPPPPRKLAPGASWPCAGLVLALIRNSTDTDLARLQLGAGISRQHGQPVLLRTAAVAGSLLGRPPVRTADYADLSSSTQRLPLGHVGSVLPFKCSSAGVCRTCVRKPGRVPADLISLLARRR